MLNVFFGLLLSYSICVDWNLRMLLPKRPLEIMRLYVKTLSHNRGSGLSQLVQLVSSRAASPVILACFLQYHFKSRQVIGKDPKLPGLFVLLFLSEM